MGKRSKYAIAENHTFALLNVVRHNSDQLHKVTFEIIASFWGLHSEVPNYSKKHIKNLSVLPTPSPTIAIFFNVVATIILKDSFVCFWDAAHHNNDDKIKILNALI